MNQEDFGISFHGEYDTREFCTDDILLLTARKLSNRLQVPIEALRSQLAGQWESLGTTPSDLKRFDGEVEISHFNDPEIGSTWIGDITVFLTGEDDEVPYEVYSGMVVLLVVH